MVTPGGRKFKDNYCRLVTRMSACHVCLLVCLFNLSFVWNKVSVRKKYRHLCVKEAVLSRYFYWPSLCEWRIMLTETQISFPEPSPCGTNGMERIGFVRKKNYLLIYFLLRRELLCRPFLDIVVWWVKDRLFLFTLWAMNRLHSRT